MLNQPTLEKMRAMRLTGMAEAFAEQLEKPLDLDFESRLAFIVEREWYTRENRRLSRRLRDAKLKQPACVENIDFDHKRGLNQSKIMEISQCNWVRNHLSLLITGPTGCGKTYLACALAHKACLQGFSTRYFRLPRLWHDLKVAKADGTFSKWLSQISKVDVIILDDWGLTPLDDEQKRDLLEILDDRYQRSSTIITSQLPTSNWHEYLNQETLADAILDRLLHQAIKLPIPLEGDSLRKKYGKRNAEKI
jgi:DNA replication protein DnaC